MEKIKVSETNLLKPIDREVIKLADEYGYKGISVCCYDETIKESIYWSTRGSVKFMVGEPDENSKLKGRDSTSSGWPAVWRIVEKLGGNAGCGNSHQRQLDNDHPYSEVSYRKIDGEWYVFNFEKIIKETSIKYGI